MSGEPSNAAGDVLLEATGVTKTFPGVRALDRVRLTVRRGRLTALLGENGAGKSTLMNILAGVFPPDAGEIRVADEVVRFANPRDARAAGIAIIFQELNDLPNLSIAENLFLGREPLTALGLLDYPKMNAEADRWLRRLGLALDPAAPLGSQRVGQRQVVEIAKAVSLEARVLIMDEPTSALTAQEVQVLFGLIRKLKEDGVGIIYITHKLDELAGIADDITVFRDGQLIAERPFRGVTREEMIRLMVGRELDFSQARAGHAAGDEVLRVESLSLPHPGRASDYLLKSVSFHVRRGEVLGIFGLMGAGRTELLETIFGLHAGIASGQVLVEGRLHPIRNPADAMRAGLALAPEDRKAEGLVLGMNVAENTTLASLQGCTQLGVIRSAKETAQAQSLTSRLGVKTPSLRQAVRNLSGGNQQKVVLAKWLATGPKVLLLDEPTRGIDVHAKREIYGLIEELVRSGLGVVLVSSELPEILAVADRIMVLCEGRVTGEFMRAEATEENLMRAAVPAREAA